MTAASLQPAMDHYRGPRARPGWILALACGVVFMVVLDIAVVNVALPSLQADLRVDQAALQWVVVSYGLMLGGFLLLGGRAADLLGRRKILVAGLSLFTAASLAAGLSDSLGQLIVSRLAQGFGAALATPAALSILTSTFPEGPQRNKALGMFGAVGGTAAAIGSIVGGLLTSGPGWQWIFLLNVPVGVVLIGLVLSHVPPSAPVHVRSADLPGAIALTAGLLAIVFAISKSVNNGWTSGTTMSFLGTGIALLGMFLWVEKRASSPLVPLAIFRRRTFTTGNAVAALVWGCFFALMFQATLFMQQVLGYSALRTGAATLVIPITSLVVAAVIAPRMVDRSGAGVVLAIGQLSSAVGLLLLARVPADASYWTDLFPAFFALGIGIGFSELGAQVAAFIGVEETLAGLAGGMIETSREVGAALGTAVVASIVAARAADVGSPGGRAADAAALTEGFQRGALFLAALTVVGAVASLLVLRPAERAAAATARSITPARVTAGVAAGS